MENAMNARHVSFCLLTCAMGAGSIVSAQCGPITQGQPTVQQNVPRPPSQPSVSQAQRPAQGVSLPTYDTLLVAITTGGDDLRYDSTATLTMWTNGGNRGWSCVLKSAGEDTWDNGSTHNVPCSFSVGDLAGNVLPAQTLDALRSVTFSLFYIGQSGSFGHDWDNWDVNAIRISAYKAGSHDQPICLWSVKGDPLVRLKQSNYAANLSLFPSDC
jgi:hypothetical protein